MGYKKNSDGLSLGNVGLLISLVLTIVMALLLSLNLISWPWGPFLVLVFGVIDLIGALIIMLEKRKKKVEENEHEVEKKENESGRKGKESPVIEWKVVLLYTILSIMTIASLALNLVSGLPMSWALFLVFGVIDLVMALTIAVSVLKSLGLYSSEEALGLPSGSVRAIIALSLIVIFAIMAVFMYNDLAPKSFPFYNVTTTINGTMTSITNNTSIIQVEPNQAQRDFSLQTLTTVSTLVVALAGFYFGTKSVEVAKGGKAPELSINPSGPVNLEKDGELAITVTTKPENEAIDWKIDGDEKGAVVQNKNTFKYKPSSSRKVGDKVTLTFWFISDPGSPKELKVDIVEPKFNLKIAPKIPSEAKTIILEKGKLQGDLKEALEFTVESTPLGEKFTWSVKNDTPESLRATNSNTFKYTPTPEKAAGKTVILTFTLESNQNVSSKLEVDFTQAKP